MTGNRIIAAGLAGWAAIIALAWWLADRRADICNDASTYTAEANCTVRAIAARDNVLTAGLAVALIVLVVVAVARLRRRSAVSYPTSSARHLPAE